MKDYILKMVTTVYQGHCSFFLLLWGRGVIFQEKIRILRFEIWEYEIKKSEICEKKKT